MGCAGWRGQLPAEEAAIADVVPEADPARYQVERHRASGSPEQGEGGCRPFGAVWRIPYRAWPIRHTLHVRFQPVGLALWLVWKGVGLAGATISDPWGRPRRRRCST